MKARWLGDEDASETVAFGRTWFAGEWQDVGGLSPGVLAKLRGNRFFEVSEGEGSEPVQKRGPGRPRKVQPEVSDDDGGGTGDAGA